MSAGLLEALGPAALVELTMFIALANLMTHFNTAFRPDVAPSAVPSDRDRCESATTAHRQDRVSPTIDQVPEAM